jgi:hypothetical protein
VLSDQGQLMESANIKMINVNHEWPDWSLKHVWLLVSHENIIGSILAFLSVMF